MSSRTRVITHTQTRHHTHVITHTHTHTHTQMVCYASTRSFKKEEESYGHIYILMEIEHNWLHDDQQKVD